jgi:hypothetical protein
MSAIQTTPEKFHPGYANTNPPPAATAAASLDILVATFTNGSIGKQRRHFKPWPQPDPRTDD